MQRQHYADLGSRPRHFGDRRRDPRESALPVLASVGGHDDHRMVGFDEILQSGSSKGVCMSAAHWRASIPVLPVTKTRVAGTCSCTRLPKFSVVGARWKRDPRDELPVEFLGEWRQGVVGAQPGFDVDDREAHLDGCERACHRRRGVSVNQDCGCEGDVLIWIGRTQVLDDCLDAGDDCGDQSVERSRFEPTPRSTSALMPAISRTGSTRSRC